MWTAFLIGLAAGLANTAHCLGMCGGFPLHLAKQSTSGRGAMRQMLFLTGKAFTYIFLGAIAGALGMVLLKNTPVAAAAPALRIATGSLTVLFGLLMLGVKLPAIKSLQGVADAGVVRSLFGGLLTNPSPTAAFILGLGVGFLPCPLPIGMLLVAATSHNIFEGMAIMTGVGLGTAPGLLAAGVLGIGIDRRFARSGARVAGVAVILIGLFTLGKATGIVKMQHPPAKHTTPSCCGGASH